MTKLLAFAGSARKGSVNKRLVRAAAAYASTQGAEVTVVDLRDYPMPLYDGDDETTNGLPESALKLTQLIAEHDAILIASPEYNGFPSPLLKNTVDWVSRVNNAAFSGKVVAITSASPGAMGGLRGLPHLRLLMSNLNALVIPQQAAIGGAFTAFDDAGNLSDEKQHAMLAKVINGLLATASA